jgi:hypothetical protein
MHSTGNFESGLLLQRNIFYFKNFTGYFCYKSNEKYGYTAFPKQQRQGDQTAVGANLVTLLFRVGRQFGLGRALYFGLGLFWAGSLFSKIGLGLLLNKQKSQNPGLPTYNIVVDPQQYRQRSPT